MHYLDTSVLTAYYSPEERSARIQKLLSRIEGPTISPLVEVEFCCAIARKVRSADMEASTALRIFSLMRLHLAEPRLHVVPIGTAHYNLARDWIAQLASPLRVLDALHLAVAFSNNLVLVTADKRLADSAGRFGVKYKVTP